MRIRKTKRVLLAFMALPLALAAFLPSAARAGNNASGAPAVQAEAAVLMDMDSGQTVYGRSADKKMPIASTTKIMTALVVLESCGLGEKVAVKREWTLAEGSSMYLKAGQVYTVEELLYGLLLASGNDAATALACHAAGSVEAFAELMNAKAAELGLSGSHFVNPHGLDQEGHYSTASDMARLAAAAMRNEAFEKIVSTKRAVIRGAQYTNHNKLLWLYEGAIGVKTGYTRASGRTLVSCARRGGTTLVCVTFNDPDDWDDHMALYDWGFENYATLRAGAEKYEVPVISGLTQSVSVGCAESRAFFVRNDGGARIEVSLPKFVYAPVRGGDAAGELRVYCGGELLGRLELIYEHSVPLDESVPLSFWERVKWYWYFASRHGIYNVYPLY